MMDLLIQGDLRSRSGTLRKKLECFFISPCIIMISVQMGQVSVEMYFSPAWQKFNEQVLSPFGDKNVPLYVSILYSRVHYIISAMSRKSIYALNIKSGLQYIEGWWMWGWEFDYTFHMNACIKHYHVAMDDIILLRLQIMVIHLSHFHFRLC